MTTKVRLLAGRVNVSIGGAFEVGYRKIVVELVEQVDED